MTEPNNQALRLREPLMSDSSNMTQDNEEEKSWYWRICNVYPRSLLFAMFVQYFNMGLDVMRTYCMKDLFKRVY